MSIDMFALIGLAVVFLVLIIIFFIPTERRIERTRKKRAEKVEEQHSRDWQEATLRLERHVHSLKERIVELERQEKVRERELNVERQKYAQLQEKLVQERGWKDKETQDQQKKSGEILKYKEALKAAQDSHEVEHGQLLRLQGEARELKSEVVDLQEKRRNLEDALAKAKAQNDAQRQEIARLKEENAKLSKKQDDVEWIARVDYDKLAHQLRIRENELERLRRPAPPSAS